MENSNASQALHRFIMDIQEKDKTCNLCHKTVETRPQLLLHKLCPSHVKKLKASLLLDNFVVMCLACNISISDYKQAQIHIQLPEHKSNLKSWNKEHKPTMFICEICGLSFRTVVGLEIHQSLPPHELLISSSDLPNLFELVMDLGGIPLSSSEKELNKFCKVCNEEYGRSDEYISHLFSKLHIRQLRGSLCIVCSKVFIHASDRESHLGSYKHVPLSISIQDLLERARSIISSKKNGYLCMYCMVWCNSWPCFELHLLHSPHYEAILKRKTGKPSCSILPMKVPEEKECYSCTELTRVDWRRWIEEPAGLSGWCHSCGVTLISPDTVESHLEDHYIGKICQAGKLHLPVVIADTNSTELFSCFTCSVSFKSEFCLVVHEALFQHHSRIATESSKKHHYWCMKCGINAMSIKDVQLKMSSEGLQPSQMPSESIHEAKHFELAFPEICKSGAGIVSCENAEPFQLKESSKQSGESNRSSSYRKNGVNCIDKNPCEEGVEFLGGNSDVLRQPENQETDSFIASNVEEIKRKDCVDNGNTSFSSNEYDQGQGTPEKMGKCAAQSDIDLVHSELDAITHDVENKDNLKPKSPSLLPNQGHQSSGKFAECSESVHHAGIVVPIVAAAAFSASETLEEVLQSVATVVINTLSATLPELPCSCASTLKNFTKRECEVGDVPDSDNKRRCIETSMGLEVALQRGFKPLISGSSLLSHTSLGSSVKVSCAGNHSDPIRVVNPSLQHDSDVFMISNSNSMVDGKGSFGEPVKGLVQSSLTCMAQNFQHAASVVVAAGIVPHSSFATKGIANDDSCDVNEGRKDELAGHSKRKNDDTGPCKVDNLDRATHVDLHCVSIGDDVLVKKKSLEVDSDKLKEQVSAKQKSSSFSKMDVVSSSSSETEDESESDSGCNDMFLGETHVKLVQTDNDFSDSEDSSDSKSE